VSNLLSNSPEYIRTSFRWCIAVRQRFPLRNQRSQIESRREILEDRLPSGLSLVGATNAKDPPRATVHGTMFDLHPRPEQVALA
jgi:hypothetical protein